VTDDGPNLRFEIGFAEAVDPGALVFLYFDADSDPATGSPGLDLRCEVDAALIGADYVVTVGYGSAWTRPSRGTAVGGCSEYEFALLGSYRREPAALTVVLPRRELALLDDEVSIKIATAVEGAGGLGDFAPGIGEPPVVLSSP
jgi:hypothetical protein